MATEPLSPTLTLADLAVTHPVASRVFHRHGLDFCCHGRRPLAEACAERGLPAESVVAEIAAEEEAAPDLVRWDARPLEELVRHIYLRLAAFEAELMDHIHLENNVLFRRALAA